MARGTRSLGSGRPGSAAAPRRRRLSVEQRRAGLVSAATELFLQRGYHGVSTDEVAQLAGASQSLIFHYFPSKVDLFIATMEVQVDELVKAVIDAPRGASPFSQLRGGLHAFYDYAATRGEHFNAVLRGEMAAVDPRIGALVDAGRERLIDFMSEEFASHDATGDLGEPRLIRAGLHGWIGFVQEQTIDWLKHRDLTHEELIAAALRTLVAALPALESRLKAPDS